MADSNIAGLTAGAAVVSGDLFAGSNNGATTLVKKTAAQIATYCYGNIANNLIFTTDNTNDIGASGANRPANIYVAANITAGNVITAAGGITIGLSQINASGTGVLLWTNAITGSNVQLYNNIASGVLKINDASTGAGVIVLQAVAVSALPAAATVGVGAKAFVTDATTSTFMGALTGGGSNKVPVHSDGTNWVIG